MLLWTLTQLYFFLNISWTLTFCTSIWNNSPTLTYCSERLTVAISTSPLMESFDSCFCHSTSLASSFIKDRHQRRERGMNLEYYYFLAVITAGVARRETATAITTIVTRRKRRILNCDCCHCLQCLKCLHCQEIVRGDIFIIASAATVITTVAPRRESWRILLLPPPLSPPLSPEEREGYNIVALVVSTLTAIVASDK